MIYLAPLDDCKYWADEIVLTSCPLLFVKIINNNREIPREFPLT